ncbi:hypothetical protein AMAG_15668 [Allomyces macrogynus ATCC 38327]|uniref:2'-phosphotransferase n=1 Tax=Allomyces macrogynus (strain ATCC 38327) TaxID=578462 RepID=A0A0L0TA52_ALLM3|nr:hypothetical protein AMAG_15668 [Allomyces macrogynus ATCC 38327]|eukprot:KNE71434.1 hypothetical protein AMAG_15668 [Allomyces macrogynus ATCC 38327]
MSTPTDRGTSTRPPTAISSSANGGEGGRGRGRGRGRGSRGGGGRPSSAPRGEGGEGAPHDVQLSKALSRVLRHAADEMGIQISPDGWVLVDHLLAHPRFKKYTLADVQAAVNNNDKKRFSLRRRPIPPADAPPADHDDLFIGKWEIKANQGHSLKSVTDLDLTSLTPATVPATIVHGTSRSAWEKIREDGLRPMSRHHVHCAKGLPGDSGVISGMRRACDVHVFIDVAKAMGDGMPWFESPNGVVLSAGLDGVIAPKYFSKVMDRSGDVLWPPVGSS